MNRIKGQSIVEFALIVPMMIFMFLSIIYTGIAFLDYTQYSNAARDAARDISLSSDKQTLVSRINAQNADQLKRYATQITDLYTATWHAEFLKSDGKTVATTQADAVDVRITIDLARDDLPSALESLHILPKNLKTISFKMSLENK